MATLKEAKIGSTVTVKALSNAELWIWASQRVLKSM